MVDAADLTPDLQPTEIAERVFATSRRGYDTAEVRAFLQTVADAYRAALDRIAAAEAKAADVVAAAEVRAAEVLREAQDEARRMLAAVGDERQRGFDEGAARAEAVLAEAEEARKRTEEAAEREAERLIAEAEAARTKVLRDLRRRRKTARTHLEQLQAAREKLLGALAEVRNSIEATTAGLRDALPEAKAAADAAARRVAAEEDLTVEQLEGEIQALRFAGLPLVPADAPTAAGAAPENGTATVGERRSSAVRIVRPVRAQDPITGLPEEALLPLEAPHPDEAVRLVTAEDVAAEAEAELEAPEAEAPEVDDPVEVVAEAPLEPDRSASDDDAAVDPADVVVEAPLEPDRSDEPEPTAVIEPEAREVDDPVEVVAEAPLEPDRSHEPEPAAVIEAEPEPEPAPEPAEPAHGGSPPPVAAVDALFARLKSERVERVAAAEAVLDDPAVADDGDEAVSDEPEPERRAEPDDGPVAEEVVVHRGGGASREVLLARRDEAIAPVVASLSRRLKRLLADEQNELLDDLRRRGTAGALAAPGDHGARWAAEASVDLAMAAAAGTAYLDPQAKVDLAPGDVVEVAEAFAELFAAPLRQRLLQVLAASEDDAELAGEGVRSVYRTWRADRLGAAVEHAVLDAFAAGMAGSCSRGTPVCWIVDDGGTPCPDAEDNALAGELGCGLPFPTGHLRPPAHPGCRCILVPVAITD